MNKLNFESSKFNFFLHKIAEESSQISSQNNVLLIIKSSTPPFDCIDKSLSAVVNYLSFHAEHIKSSHTTLIRKIHNKFKGVVQKQTQEIQTGLVPCLEEIHKLELGAYNNINPICKPSISLQIKAAPRDIRNLEENLQIVLDNFPRYQLYNDLSVIDTAFQNLPQDFNKVYIRDALNMHLLNYHLKNPEALPASRFPSLIDETLSLLKTPKPILMGIIIETSQADTENPALLFDLMTYAKHKIPCLVNRHFFHAQKKNFKLYPDFKLEDLDIYVQKTGDLCALLPKGQSLEDWGFNAESMQKSNGEHLLPSKPVTQLALDIEAMLMNESEDSRFFRLVAFSGHGSYPGYPHELDIKQRGFIAGLDTKDFQQVLLALKGKNLAFMYLSSCYGGGTNSTAIHLPDKTLPCPIFIQSAFDTITAADFQLTSPYDGAMVLHEAQKMLFPTNSKGDFLSITPRQLTFQDRIKLSKLPCYMNLAEKFTNLVTLILPSNKEDIPKIAYCLADNEDIFDVSREARLRSKSIKQPLEVIEDYHKHRKGYLFSEPLIPFSLSVSGDLPLVLLSRGGTVHHILKQIIAPQQDIEEIAKETFNAFQCITKTKEREAASKVFFIGNFLCKYKGKDANLSKVMLKQTLNTREVIFQIEGKDKFHRLVFHSDPTRKGYAWKKEAIQIIDTTMALKLYYQALGESIPLKETLYQMSAGQTSLADFLEAFEQYFFLGVPPPTAKLYSAILKDKYNPPNSASALKCTLTELTKGWTHAPEEQWHEILRQAFDFADIMEQPHQESLIRETSYTPLMKAVKDGNLELAKEILAKDPQTLEAVHLNRSTALGVAIYENKNEIAKWLFKQGANIYHLNRFGIGLIYFLCFTHPELIFWFYQQNVNLHGDQGALALNELLQKKDWEKTEFLIDLKVGAGSKSYFLFSEAILESPHIKIIKKILGYPHVKINAPMTRDLNTALHESISKHNFELFQLLMTKGADPQAKNLQLRTPLHFASLYGKEKAVDFALCLLHAGTCVDTQDDAGQTPLHYAIKEKNRSLIVFLIQHGASVHIEDKCSRNPLEYAVQHPGLLEFILKIPGLLLTPKLCKLDDLFLGSVWEGNLSLMKSLVEHGANINARFESTTPPLSLHLLVSSSSINSEPFIQFFIDHGGDLSLQDDDGDTVMHVAMRKQDIKVLNLLRAAKIPEDTPLNKRSESPFIAALSNPSKTDFLKTLLQTDKLLNKDIALLILNSLTKLTDGYPYPCALFMKKVIEILISKGQAQSNPSLHLYKCILEKDVEGIKNWFLTYPLSKPNEFYSLPILHAALYFAWEPLPEYREAVSAILKNYPESLKEHYLELPTQLAQDVDILKALVRHGAEVDANVPLQAYNLELIKLLADKGADLSSKAGMAYLEKFIHDNLKEGVDFLLPKFKESLHPILTSAILDYRPQDILDALIHHPYMDLQKASTLGSPLFAAILKKNIPVVVTLLCKQSAYIPRLSLEKYSSPLLLVASMYESDDTLELVNLILASDYSNCLNSVTTSEETALYLALARNNSRMAALLIESGADISLLDKNKVSPLHKALQQNDIGLAILLINKGADVNICDKLEKNTPLHAAMLLGTLMKEDQLIPLIKLLIENGARWDIPNNNGLTAKNIAVKFHMGKIHQLMSG